MSPEISNFIPSSMAETGKYIEVADGNFITAKKKRIISDKMCGNNIKPFIDMLYNVLFAPDLCDILFYVFMLMNLGNA